MELSIVIPCYNEKYRIGKTIESIKRYLLLNKIKSEIIFINDGSSDETKIILNQIIQDLKKNSNIKAKIIDSPINRGKGYAIKQGIQLASGKYVLLCDADLSTPITELDKLKKYSQKYDLVIGSRKQKDAKVIVAQSPLREFLGKTYSYLSKMTLGVNINDFTCGFKLIRNTPAKIIARKMTIDRWSYDSELLKIATLLNYKIKEVGIIWKNDQNTKVRLSRDVLISLFDLFKIYINSQFKKYE